MTEFNWATATPEERRAHWVTALRSGKYEQTTGALKRHDGLCCLGVLCDLVDSSRWNSVLGDIQYTDMGFGYDSMPPDAFVADVELDNVDVEALANANDHGESFEEIADRIERSDYSNPYIDED